MKKRITYYFKNGIDSETKVLIQRLLDNQKVLIDWSQEHAIRIESDSIDLLDKLINNMNDTCKKQCVEKISIFELITTVEFDENNDLFNNIINIKQNTDLCELILGFNFIYTSNDYMCIVSIDRVEYSKIEITIKDMLDENISFQTAYENMQTAINTIINTYFTE